MSEPTLNYGDQKLFALRIPHGIVYAPAYLTLAVYLLPPLLTFLYYFYLPWVILRRYEYAKVFGFLAIVVFVSSGIVFVLSLKAKQRRMRAVVLLLVNILPALALFFFMSHYAEWLSQPILDRREVAERRMDEIVTACHNYAERHADAEGAHYPPHLAALVAGGYLLPEELIDPASSTTPAKVPAGLVEADWPRIAADIDAHCDFVYLGADWVRDGALNSRQSAQVSWGFNNASLILGYSKARHFRAGSLVAGYGFVSDGAFSKLWAQANVAREELLLPPITLGGAIPTAPPAPSYLLGARLKGGEWQEADRIFSARMVRVTHAILNYAVEHEGHFPPHLAALVAGHNIAPEDLLYPKSATTPLATDLSKLTENDWPEIARELEAHCDLIYLGAGMENIVALDRWCATPKAGSHEMLLFYTKPLYPDLHTLASFHPRRKDFSTLRFQIPGSLREAFMASRETRVHLRLPAVQMNVVPELKVPAIRIAGGPKASDEAALRREISRRNAMVIMAACLRAQSQFSTDLRQVELQVLLAGQYILPRHLHDPELSTPLPDTRDAGFPRFETYPFPVPGDANWRSAAVDHYVQLHSDYIVTRDKAVEGIQSELIVYSKNDYAKTGRIYAFADGTAKFLPDIRHH